VSQDPFLVLGVSPEADDDEIKRRYLAQVRLHSPERAPERFQEIRAAYEAIRDRRGRLRVQLLGTGGGLGPLKLALLEAGARGRPSRDAVTAVLLEAAASAAAEPPQG